MKVLALIIKTMQIPTPKKWDILYNTRGLKKNKSRKYFWSKASNIKNMKQNVSRSSEAPGAKSLESNQNEKLLLYISSLY